MAYFNSKNEVSITRRMEYIYIERNPKICCNNAQGLTQPGSNRILIKWSMYCAGRTAMNWTPIF